MGKEPELLREYERHWLYIVGLAHSLSSGTSLLERAGTWFYAGVVSGVRQRAGIGLLIAP